MKRLGWALDARAARVAWLTLGALGVAAGYYLGGVLGAVLSVPPSGFAIVWPSTAFLIAVLLIAPPRLWWVYLAGVIPAHFHMASHFQHEAALPVLLSQVAGNIGLAVATALALRGPRGAPQRFDDFGSVLRFILLAGLVVPAVGNALILGLHLMSGWAGSFWLSWRQWMLASVFPALTIPPALVIAFHRGTVAEGRAGRRAGLELAAVCLVLFASNFVAFGWAVGDAWWPVLALVSLPLMLWVAVRMGVGSTSLALLVFAAAIIVRALDGQGPFAVNASSASVLSLQVFLTALSIPLLLLSALNQARRGTEALLTRSEARMQLVAAATDTGLWQWNPANQQLWMTESCRSMFGIGSDAPISPATFLDVVHPDDRPHVEETLGSMLTSGDVEASSEFCVLRADGAPQWFILRTHTEFDANRRPVSISGVFRNVTQRVTTERQLEDLSQRLLALQEDERQKIAEELHESTAQNLAALSLNLSGLKRRIALSEGAGHLMDEAFTSLDQARSELRTFTYLLRPAGLDREGLCAVLRRHVEAFSRWSGLKASLTGCPHADELPLEHQRAVLRIVQESLMNVQRHAAATHASVRLRRRGDDMHVVIRDNGRGLAPVPREPEDGPPRTGVGIPGMAARVRQLGGRMSIRSCAQGTIVHAAIPMAEAAPRHRRTRVLTLHS